MKIVYSFLLSLCLFSVGFSQEKPQDILNTAWETSWSIYLRGWGSLQAFCSSGIIYADKETVRLITAGHCIALPQKDKGLEVGFAVSKDGLNFTKAIVVDSGWKPKMDVPSFTFPFRNAIPTIENSSQYDDIADTTNGDWAILEFENIYKIEPINLIGDSSKLQLGDKIYSVGYPSAGDKVAADGIISNLGYYAPQTPWDNYLAANISAAPGSSGSPIFDSTGKIIGILVAGSGDVLHFLTKINLVKEKLNCIDKPVCKTKK